MDNQDFNIVFMGTPSFAVPSLNAILEEGYNVTAVVSAPDRPAGRGRKLRKSAVSEFAIEKGLTLLRPERLRDEHFVEAIQEAQPHLIVVVAFRMLPDIVWQIPAFGTINLHASLLPQYRGAAPINWALMNGESETGVSTFFIDHKIDTGKVIDRNKISIPSDMTAGELHDIMMEKGAGMLVRSLHKIRSGEAYGISQERLEAEFDQLKPAPKLTKDHCRIDWKRSAQEIHNRVRGLSPSPTAFTELQLSTGMLQRVKIYRGKIAEEFINESPGTIIVKDGRMLVACGTGCYEVLELQLAGKQRLEVPVFLRGIPSGINARFD